MAHNVTLLVLLMTLGFTVATDSSLENNETSIEMFTETWAPENYSLQEQIYSINVEFQADLKQLQNRLEEVETKLLKGLVEVENKLLKQLDEVKSRIKHQDSNPEAPSDFGNICKRIGVLGSCKIQGSCSIVMEDTQNSGFPLSCGTSKDGDPMICCEPPPRISQRMCHRYSQFVYSKVTWLVGSLPVLNDTCTISKEHPEEGEYITVKRGEFPHLGIIESVSLYSVGNLISERWFLSSALYINTNIEELKVRLGIFDNTRGENQGLPVYKVVEKHAHPKYDRVHSNIRVFNVALYKLQTEVTFSPYIRPACLVTEHQLPGTAGIFIGDMDNSLKKFTVNTVPFNRNDYEEDEFSLVVNMSYNSLNIFPGYPLVVMMKDPYCTYGLIGIAGARKENSPQGFYGLSNTWPWIESLVWPH